MHNKHDNGASDNEKEQNARAANKDTITTPSKIVFKNFFKHIVECLKYCFVETRSSSCGNT